jgi:outer membrane protein assembly factor BamB
VYNGNSALARSRYARDEMRIRLLTILALSACGDNLSGTIDPGPYCDAWHQWGNNASHSGTSCVRGQPLHTVLADTVYDPFLPQEVADAEGDLLVHYQTPLIDGDDLYMMTKKGTYTPCKVTPDGHPSCFEPDEQDRLNSQIWSEQHFEVAQDGTLALQWSFDSDWKPEPQIGFEPMFQPALAGTLIAIPGAGGALWELDAQSGQVVRHVQPFGAVIDPDIYVSGGLSVGDDGTIYYNAFSIGKPAPLDAPARGWLVAVSPAGDIRTVNYESLVTEQPTQCFYTYDIRTTPLPWPPANSDGTLLLPPSSICGLQRPGINTTPAIGPDGTIFVVSRAHYNARYSYVIAVDRSLSTRWATSLRDFLHDGCGVTTPSDGTDTQNTIHCRIGTPDGVERVTGLLPAGQVIDDSSSSPVALPDGGVLYGSYSGYNGARGHLFKIDRSGNITGSYDFGWDSTPSVVGGPHDYKIVIKDNHYGQDQDGVDLGPFYITELDSSLNVRWQFQSTNTKSCVRQPDGGASCTEDNPNGFEWCINATAVDRDGTVYANSEDGNAYAISADGSLRESIFLDQALGAAYTPVALDHTGRVFTLNSGHLAILGEN